MATKTTKTTLEDFIKKYTASGARTYADFLRAEGDESEDEYAYALKNASASYDRARAGYGTRAETLASRGLSHGGYAAYLDANAYSDMQKAKREALEKKNTSEKRNRIKYSDYLRDYQNEKRKSLKDTIDDIATHAWEDNETASKYALASGLDGEIAEMAAELGVDMSKSKWLTSETKRKLINSLVGKNYSRGSLYYYLTALGMSQDEANELADTIYALSKSKKYSSKW